MKKYTLFTACVMFLSMAFIAEPVLAGPGGQIASAIFDSTWGKVLLVVLFILFLPLIVMNSIKTKIAEKRASKDLAFMAVHSDHFDWFKLQQRVKSCFLRVHQGWQGGDLTDTSEWMTEWYWTNQQQVFLDKWKEQGLVNICDVQSVGSIRPLMLVHRNHDDGHRDSSVVVIVSAKMNDYLKDIKTGEIVEGSEEYKTVRTVWSFTLDNDEWKVSGIEQSNTIMQYIKMLDNLPPIQSTLTR